MASVMRRASAASIDELLYNSVGEVVGRITEVTVHRELIDITSHLDEVRQCAQGVSRAEANVVMVKGLQICPNTLGQWRCVYCGNVVIVPSPSAYEAGHCRSCGAGRK